jgi:hypothetical protein
MRTQLIDVSHDLFSVAERLREIDDDYRLKYNPGKGRYEVHHLGQAGNTFCLAVHEPLPDARTVEFVRRTRVERFDEACD